MGKLSQAMKPIASFRFRNTTNDSKKVCLFPGHFGIDKIAELAAGGYVLAHNSTAAIVAAGYACDEMVDDHNALVSSKDQNKVTVNANSSRCNYADLLRYVQLSNARCTKIKVTNLGGGSHRDIFDQDLEVSASSIGQKAGSQFLNLSSYKNPSNFDLDVIEIDLANQQLELDETTLAFLTVPAGADFNIEFTLEF